MNVGTRRRKGGAGKRTFAGAEVSIREAHATPPAC
jgi:hypothetical protein